MKHLSAVFLMLCMIFVCSCGEKTGSLGFGHGQAGNLNFATPTALALEPAINMVPQTIIYSGSCSSLGAEVKSFGLVRVDPTCTQGCIYVPNGGDITLNAGDYAVLVIFMKNTNLPFLPLATGCKNVTIIASKTTGVSFTASDYDTCNQPAYAASLIQSLNWFNYDNDAWCNIDDPDPWHSQNYKMIPPGFPGGATAGPVNSASNNFRARAVTIGQPMQGQAASANFKMKVGQAYQAR